MQLTRKDGVDLMLLTSFVPKHCHRTVRNQHDKAVNVHNIQYFGGLTQKGNTENEETGIA
jgi:hypothetical protein